MPTGNPLEIALAIFALTLTFMAIAAVADAVFAKGRPAKFERAAVNDNGPQARSTIKIVRRNAKSVA
ncbi:MAG TPA: hypothetical protein VK943_05625 [Arenibaculum sp.]|nr:hypothetical protein [Arenibaculum sp.]